MKEVMEIMDEIWMRKGKILKFNYKEEKKKYKKEKKNMEVLKYIRKRRKDKVRE